MQENKLYEAVANLVLQSISVWEDMHLYFLTYSTEYNTFWGLLDDNLKCTVSRYSKRNREERLVPFTMSYIGYYKVLLTKESYDRIKDQYWKKQLRILIADNKFRNIMTYLNREIACRHKSSYSNLDYRTTANSGSQIFATRVG